MTEAFERQRTVLKLHNQLREVLARMVQDSRDPYINKHDFVGVLAGTDDPTTEFLTYCRIILDTWFMLNAYKYLYRLISKEEYAIIRREYIRKDSKFWEDGPFGWFARKRKALPLLQ